MNRHVINRDSVADGLARRFSRLRARAGLAYRGSREFARLIEVNDGTYRAWERGMIPHDAKTALSTCCEALARNRVDLRFDAHELAAWLLDGGTEEPPVRAREAEDAPPEPPFPPPSRAPELLPPAEPGPRGEIIDIQHVRAALQAGIARREWRLVEGALALIDDVARRHKLFAWIPAA